MPPHTSLRRTLNAALAALAFSALSVASPVVAQVTVRGVVLDAVSAQPIVAADIVLLRADSLVDSATTDAHGRFTLRAARADTFSIRIARIGYAMLRTRPFGIGYDQSAEVEIRLQPDPSALDPIEAVVERRNARLERAGFYRRSQKGFGYFRTPDDLAELRPIFYEDLFVDMAGIGLRYDSTSPTLVRWPFYRPCPLTIAVDGIIVEGWTELLHPTDILALEVYPRPAGLPPWLAGSRSPCGAVVIWTK